MEMLQISKIEAAAGLSRGELSRLGVAVIFIAAVMIYTGALHRDVDQAYLLVAAAVIGAYMAMNIGANDVANNVGPAVGSFALTLSGAIVIAAVFEAAGALIAGGDVVSTVKKGIIDPATIDDKNVFIWVMMAALLGGAIWLNLATALGAPVSTTHSIVGGVMGAGIAARGWDIVNWESMAAIASSWVISPITGGIIAAAFLLALKRMVFFREDRVRAARQVVPVLIAVMAAAFTSYLALKGLKALVKVSIPTALALGLGAAVIVYFAVRGRVARAAETSGADREGLNKLFTIPLIFAAALLSFAHGANDVANAVGPLAGIVDSLTQLEEGPGAAKVAIPIWVMVIGAIGISIGLALFGPKLIRTVGTEITELDRSRAFCIALSAAITVIIASQLGMPISSTHVALGAVFGVGFLREFLDQKLHRVVDNVLEQHQGGDRAEAEAALERFSDAPIEEKGRILKEFKALGEEGVITDEERKRLRKALKRQLVKRTALFKIVSAWIITVPISAALAGLFYFMLRGMLLP